MELSPKMRATIALALVAFGIAACGGDPFATPPPDAGQLTAEAAYAANMKYYAEQTAQANATRPPSATQTPQPEMQFAADLLKCARVDDDGTVSDAVLRANGFWPPYLQNGQQMHVSLDHAGTRNIAPLQDVMGGGTALDVAAEGDQVCIAVNKSILEKQPSPTPQASTLPTSGRIFGGAGQGFSVSRSSKGVGYNPSGVRRA